MAARRAGAGLVVLPRPPTARSTSVRPLRPPPEPPKAPPAPVEEEPKDPITLIREFLNRKRLKEQKDYFVQGGEVFIPSRRLVWRYALGDPGLAEVGRLIYENEGQTVVDIKEWRLLSSPEFVLARAWEGVEV